jgi:hypothetical protein
MLTLGVSTLKNYISAELNSMYFALAITIAFGISIAGLVLGVLEVNNKLSGKSWIGIVGNSIVIVFFLLMVFFALR